MAKGRRITEAWVNKLRLYRNTRRKHMRNSKGKADPSLGSTTISRLDTSSHGRWGPGDWIALASMITALCALLLSVYEARLARIHNHITLRPYVQLPFQDTKEGAGIVMVTAGLGPSILRSFYVYVDGEPQRDWLQFYRSLGLPSPAPPALPSFEFSVPEIGGLYSPGTVNRLFWVTAGPQADRLRTQLSRVDIIVCYASLYGEYWSLQTSGKHEQVAGCPRPNVPGVDLKAPTELYGDAAR